MILQILALIICCNSTLLGMEWRIYNRILHAKTVDDCQEIVNHIKTTPDLHNYSPGHCLRAAAAQPMMTPIVRELLLHKNFIYDGNGENPVAIAAQSGAIETTILLIQVGCPIDSPSLYRTPLARAAANGDTDVAKILLFFNANINMQDACGFTPLMLAILENKPTMVDLLLAHNPKLELQSADTKTAWDIATDLLRMDQKYAPIIELLAKHQG